MINTLRQIARRPRASIRAALAHRCTRSAQQLAENAWGRAWLIGRAIPGTRARHAQWDALGADVAALGPAPALTRSVSMVALDPSDARAAARVAAGSASDLLCFVLPSTTTPTQKPIDDRQIDDRWFARLAAPIDGNVVVAAAPLVVHPLRSLVRATPHDGRVRARGLGLAAHFDEPILRAGDAGARPQVGAEPAPVAGATAACLLVDRRAYEAVGGLPDLAMGYATKCPAPYGVTIEALRADALNLRKMAAVVECWDRTGGRPPGAKGSSSASSIRVAA